MATSGAGSAVTLPGFCRWCGLQHAGEACHLIKALQFDPATGALVRVEFIDQLAAVETPQQTSPPAEPQPDYPRKPNAAQT